MRHRRYNPDHDLLKWLTSRTPCPYCAAAAGNPCIERDCHGEPTGNIHPDGHRARTEHAHATWKACRTLIEKQPCQVCGEPIAIGFPADPWHRCQKPAGPIRRGRGVPNNHYAIAEGDLPPEKAPAHEHQWPTDRIGGPCETCGERPSPSGVAFALGQMRAQGMGDAELLDLIAATLVGAP